MEQNDCQSVLETTEQMLAAIQREDMEQLGRILKSRQACMDRLRRPGSRITSADREMLVRAMDLDRQAQTDAQALLKRYQEEIGQHEIKSKRMFRYEYSQFNVTQGQLIDRKR